MFNYVVKDPDSSRLSGEFWIKDSVGKAKPRVLELDALLVCGLIRWKKEMNSLFRATR